MDVSEQEALRYKSQGAPRDVGSCRMDMTSCVASDLFPCLLFLSLIPQYDVHYRFNSRTACFVSVLFLVFEPESRDPDSPFRLVFVGLDSSGPIIHPLRTILVDIAKNI